jgi:hypothetical protein
MGDNKLRAIAELVCKIRSSVSIDWTLRESARAGINFLREADPQQFLLSARPPRRGRAGRVDAGGEPAHGWGP